LARTFGAIAPYVCRPRRTQVSSITNSNMRDIENRRLRAAISSGSSPSSSGAGWAAAVDNRADALLDKRLWVLASDERGIYCDHPPKQLA
jgi:hypothetical protein